MSLSNKEKREMVVNALYTEYPDAVTLTRKQVVAAVKDLPVPFPFWMTHKRNRQDDGTYAMPPMVTAVAPGKPEVAKPVAPKPAPKKKREASADDVKVEFEGEPGVIVDDLSTQYFVEMEDGREFFLFKSDKRLKEVE